MGDLLLADDIVLNVHHIRYLAIFEETLFKEALIHACPWQRL
jgi:hypothetical protein